MTLARESPQGLAGIPCDAGAAQPLRHGLAMPWGRPLGTSSVCVARLLVLSPRLSHGIDCHPIPCDNEVQFFVTIHMQSVDICEMGDVDFSVIGEI